MGQTNIQWTWYYTPDGRLVKGYSFNAWEGCALSPSPSHIDGNARGGVMENLEQVLLHLRRLRSRGWPLEVYLTPADNSIKGGVMTIVTCRMEKFSIGVVLDDRGIDPEVFRATAILREFIEGEIERRGLWKRYLEAITTRSAPSQNGKGVLWWRDTEHRPTLLEVLKAAVEAADG